jgi:beta-glucosidase
MEFGWSKIVKHCLITSAVLLNIYQVRAIYPYQDTSLSFDDRVNDLISRMTLAEKIQQLGNQVPAISRLGINAYNYWNEALHGVGRSGLATSFPQAIALSSTWDPGLIYNIASAISDEARVKNNIEGKGLTYWSPTINMARDPRWGRSEENYGEDAYLTSQIAVNFIKGMQGTDPKYFKTIATAKHFACNNVEVNRYGISSDVDERSLREYYLQAFKACVTEGKVFSIMSAYNALNGVPCPANRTLLTNILRNEWGFNGYVVSDCDAVSNVWDAHHYVSSAPEATAISLRNGTDLNCGTTYPLNADIAISNGLMSEDDINTALKRIFKARFLLGEFDPPSMVSYTSIPNSQLDCKANRDLALEAAREAIVLLKNQNNILPLHKDSVHSIAVIGPNANIVQLGGYSGSPSVSITPLQGIASKLGVDISNGVIEAENFSNQSGIQVESCSEGGSDVGYIENGDYTEYDSVNFASGKNKFDFRVASFTSGGNIQIILDSINGPLVGSFAISGTGGWQNWTTLSNDLPITTGIHRVYLKFTGGTGFLFNVNWFKFYNPADTIPLPGGINLKYASGCSIKGTIDQAAFDSAVNLARNSDVAIVVCGTDLTVADEGTDRTSLDLPGVQEQLIKAVFHANPKTIIVLVTGFSLSINWEQDSIPAILTAWYDGQAQGAAIADVIFGDYNPRGKLSTTWYKSVSDLPSMNDYDIKTNRTYMYFKGTPLYPFGYGLSYTTFGFSNLQLSSNNLNYGDSILVSANIKNTGKVAGDEVAQMYVHIVAPAKIRPIKELKGFSSIHLQPGETGNVSFKMKNDGISYYDVNSKTFVVENGKADILIGNSSQDIRLDTEINVSGGIVAQTYRQDPFSITKAEFFENKSASVRIIACSDGGQCIDSLINNSYIVFKNFDFTTEAKQFNASLASTLNTGTSIQIVLDSLNGQLAGTLNVLSTGSWNNYVVQSCLLNGVSGVRNVYLIFKTGISNACRLNWFSFQKTIGEEIKFAKPDDEYQVSIYPNPSYLYCTIKYQLPSKSDVKIEVYSLQGILIKSVCDNVQNAGIHQLKIVTNDSHLTEGAYIVCFRDKTYFKSLLMNLIK